MPPLPLPQQRQPLIRIWSRRAAPPDWQAGRLAVSCSSARPLPQHVTASGDLKSFPDVLPHHEHGRAGGVDVLDGSEYPSFNSAGWSEFEAGETTLALHPAFGKNPAPTLFVNHFAGWTALAMSTDLPREPLPRAGLPANFFRAPGRARRVGCICDENHNGRCTESQPRGCVSEILGWQSASALPPVGAGGMPPVSHRAQLSKHYV